MTPVVRKSRMSIVVNLLLLRERDKRLPGWIDHPQLPPLSFIFALLSFHSLSFSEVAGLLATFVFAMHFSAVFLAGLVITFQTAFAAPTTSPVVDVTTFKGETTGRLIVKLKDDADKDAHLNWLASKNHSYSLSHNWNSTFFNAFAGKFHVSSLTATYLNANNC